MLGQDDHIIELRDDVVARWTVELDLNKSFMGKLMVVTLPVLDALFRFSFGIDY